MADNSKENVQKAKELLKKFNELWDEEAIEHIYTNKSELKNLACKLEAMKLADDFLLSDLTEEERETMNQKVYVLSHT